MWHDGGAAVKERRADSESIRVVQAVAAVPSVLAVGGPLRYPPVAAADWAPCWLPSSSPSSG